MSINLPRGLPQGEKKNINLLEETLKKERKGVRRKENEQIGISAQCRLLLSLASVFSISRLPENCQEITTK